MSTVTSRDGTTIAFERAGDGACPRPRRRGSVLPLVRAESGGSAFVVGMSSGAVLALEAAASGAATAKLALYEPPFTVDDEQEQESDGFAERIEQLVAAGRRGDAVEFFLTSAGVPAESIAEMRNEPSWPLFEAVAPTLVYDNAVLGDGLVPRDRAATLMVPALVANGGQSPDFFGRAEQVTADAIPRTQHLTLDGQSWGQVAPAALAPMLRQFFL